MLLHCCLLTFLSVMDTLFLALLIALICQNVRSKAATRAQEDTVSFWRQQAYNQLKATLKRPQNTQWAKSAVFFLGDGMGPPVVTAARIYRSQRSSGNLAYQEPFTFENFPHVGLQKTYDLTSHVTDSASSATAFLRAVKANTATTGVTGSVPKSSCNNLTPFYIDSIADWALQEGKSVGFVTTTRVTHATPSGLYARTSNRDWESDADMPQNATQCTDIAQQLVSQYPGKLFQVIMGGGRRKFFPKTFQDPEGYPPWTTGNKTAAAFGQRNDERNLVNEWLDNAAGRRYVWNATELRKLQQTGFQDVKGLMGLFDYDHMDYSLLQEQLYSTDNPNLEEMTLAAITILSQNPNGYFLLVEGGRIDQALHYTYARLAMEETIQFENAVATAVSLVNQDDTLIVVTGDHSHAMSIAGYPSRSIDILGTFMTDENLDGKYSTILTFADGPAAVLNGPRLDMKGRNTTDLLYQFPALITDIQEAHGGEDVAVYAQGPWSHIFTGVYENTYIAEAMAFSLCIGPAKPLCIEQKKAAAMDNFKLIDLLALMTRPKTSSN